MAETQYTYKIVLDGTTALSQAITFKQRLEQELSKIQFNAQLNVGQLNAQLKGAAKNVTKAQASATKAAWRLRSKVSSVTSVAWRPRLSWLLWRAP